MSTFPVDPPVTPAASAPEDAGAANRRELSQEEIATLPLQALLVRAGHITLDQLADALRENVATGRSVEDIALSRGWLSAAQLDALRAAKQSYAPGAPAFPHPPPHPRRSRRHLPRPLPRPRRSSRRMRRPRPLRRSSKRRPPHAGLRSACAACPGRAGASARACSCTRTGRRGPGSRACPRRRSTRRARLGRRPTRRSACSSTSRTARASGRAASTASKRPSSTRRT